MNTQTRINQICSALADHRGSARTRLLTRDQIRCAVVEHEAALQAHSAEGEVVTTLYAGFVPNSYRGAAKADKVTLRGETWSVSRTHAQKRAHGDGNNLIVRVRRPEQTQGRIILSVEV